MTVVPRSHALAEALAVRLDAVVPYGVRVRAREGRVEVHAHGVPQGGSTAAVLVDNDNDDDRTLGRRIEIAARAVLTGVQDAITEWQAGPWPPGMPPAGAQITQGRLWLWYGDIRAPALRADPIEVSQVMGGDAFP